MLWRPWLIFNFQITTQLLEIEKNVSYKILLFFYSLFTDIDKILFYPYLCQFFFDFSLFSETVEDQSYVD